MQDKDQKLIWESYSQSNPSEKQQLNPAEITAEHLMYPDAMPGQYFEEDHLTELPHFAETYHAVSRELVSDAEHDKEEDDLVPEDPAVFHAGIKYEFSDDDSEGVVIIYANEFMRGFYVNSRTYQELEHSQAERIFNTEITWNYGTTQQPAMKTLIPRNITVQKYEEMKREEGERFSDYY